MSINHLTALQVSRAKPQEKNYRLYDGGGVSLLITPSGAKWWRLAYTFDHVRKELSLGVYPAVSLADARERRDAAHKLVAAGINPSAQRKATQSATFTTDADSFEVIAREWHAAYREHISEEHAKNILKGMEKDVFPWLGPRKIEDLTPLDIKGCLDRVKARGTVAVARKVRVVCSQVFTYAITTARITHNPAASLTGYLPPISKTRRHFSAITEAKELAPLLRIMDGYTGSVVTRSALKLLPMLLLRPGELRAMTWDELDLERGELMIPPERMKMKLEHLVPLPRQAVAVLQDLYPLTRRSRYCFPSTRTAARCLSDNTLNAALRYMGYDGDTVTAHGFRATARTILDEVLGYRPDIIEHQLAHVVRDPNGRAYNRTTHLEYRREMLQRWADYLEEIKA